MSSRHTAQGTSESSSQWILSCPSLSCGYGLTGMSTSRRPTASRIAADASLSASSVERGARHCRQTLSIVSSVSPVSAPQSVPITI